MSCEYDCRDCGIHVVNYATDTPEDPPICNTCRYVPGWQNDPKLRKIFRPTKYRDKTPPEPRS